MTIVCIKIGENERSTYSKFDVLSRHLDIIEMLPRKRDKEGKLLMRTMGKCGDEEFLGLNVDMDKLTDEEHATVRRYLREPWEEVTGRGKEPVITPHAKRLRGLDLTAVKAAYLGLSKETLAKIAAKAEDRRAKKSPKMMEINDFKRVIPFTQFAKAVVNRETGQTLEEELELSGKTLKECMGRVKTKRDKWQKPSRL